MPLVRMGKGESIAIHGQWVTHLPAEVIAILIMRTCFGSLPVCDTGQGADVPACALHRRVLPSEGNDQHLGTRGRSVQRPGAHSPGCRPGGMRVML